MDTKKSTFEDLLVLGGAVLIVCAIVQESSREISPAGVEAAAETVEGVTPAEVPSVPRPGSPITFVPLHPRERIPE